MQDMGKVYREYSLNRSPPLYETSCQAISETGLMNE